jgi:hypothetical protein
MKNSERFDFDVTAEKLGITVEVDPTNQRRRAHEANDPHRVMRGERELHWAKNRADASIWTSSFLAGYQAAKLDTLFAKE